MQKLNVQIINFVVLSQLNHSRSFALADFAYSILTLAEFQKIPEKIAFCNIVESQTVDWANLKKKSTFFKKVQLNKHQISPL